MMVGSTPIDATRFFDVLGAVAQLGERLHGMHEVTGSTPVSSTKFMTTRQWYLAMSISAAKHGWEERAVELWKAYEDSNPLLRN
jgi:hypothetical protein